MLEALVSRLVGGGGGLESAAAQVLESYVTPAIAQLRAALVSRITGEPPNTLEHELLKLDWSLTPEQRAALWCACVAAIANERDDDAAQRSAATAQ